MKHRTHFLVILLIVQLAIWPVLLQTSKAVDAEAVCPPPALSPSPVASFTPHPTFPPTYTPARSWTLSPTPISKVGLLGRIVFMSNRDMADKDRNQLYMMNADGSYTVRLTHDDFDYWWPSVSPDGKHIAFSSDRCGGWHFYMMDIDGKNIVAFPDQVSNAEYQATWSPDGTRIAFTMNNEIYAMNIDGSDLVDLTNNPATDQRPSWSPDGKHIVFGSSRDYPDPTDHNRLDNQIYVMNADGSDQIQLTHYVDSATFPAWSPDGRYIAFELLGPTGGIMIMNADGSNPHKVSPTVSMVAWSPDGKYLALSEYESMTNANYGNGGFVSALYAINVDTGQSIQLTDFAAEVKYPSWGS